MYHTYTIPYYTILYHTIPYHPIDGLIRQDGGRVRGLRAHAAAPHVHLCGGAAEHRAHAVGSKVSIVIKYVVK
jgi:hypothetical protein